jgi:hypothetical protein
MALPVFVIRKAKEEGWPIETMTRAELRQLFGRGLITKDRGRWVSGNKFD